MASYFLLLEAAFFHRELAPALTAARCQRNFAPCQPLCAALLPAARDFAARYHTGLDEPWLAEVARNGAALPYDRDSWRHLAGEVLFYGATAIPHLLTAPETLACLLDGASPLAEPMRRAALPPILQAHRGSRDLVFGGFYRPDHAGYNDTDDVLRLSCFLSAIQPETWDAETLAALLDLAGADDRAEELAYARQCFEALRDLYQQAAGVGQVIVCEDVYG
jgi:hypothetical protein